MTQTISRRQRASDDKRERVLRAALELIPQLGLHNTPMASIAQKAGVAKGTPYLYFDSKEALINALYLELVHQRKAAFTVDADPATSSVREATWRAWSQYTRWHLDNPDAANFIQQCEASGILTPETIAEQRQIDSIDGFSQSVKEGVFRNIPLPVFIALFIGPVLVLAELQAKGEITVTEKLLRTTFDGIARSVLTDPGPDRVTSP